MRVRTLPYELGPRAQNEIALCSLPQEVALVAPKPHVRPGGGERVFLIRRFVRGRSGQRRGAYVGVPVELAEGICLCAGESGSK
jgi:hypothetical protein